MCISQEQKHLVPITKSSLVFLQLIYWCEIEDIEGYKNSYDGSPFGSLLILFVLDKHDTDTEEPTRVSVIQDQLGKGN